MVHTPRHSLGTHLLESGADILRDALQATSKKTRRHSRSCCGYAARQRLRGTRSPINYTSRGDLIARTPKGFRYRATESASESSRSSQGSTIARRVAA